MKEQCPEGVVGREQRQCSDVSAARQAAAGSGGSKLLIATVGELRHNVELDPAGPRLVVGDEETMRAAAPGADRNVAERRQRIAQTRHVAAGDEQVDVAIERSEVGLAAQNAPLDIRALERLEREAHGRMDHLLAGRRASQRGVSHIGKPVLKTVLDCLSPIVLSPCAMRHGYYSPVRRSTEGTVCRRILRSRPNERCSMYSMSSRSRSSKVVVLRPFTCQSPVMPGVTSSRRVCQSW